MVLVNLVSLDLEKLRAELGGQFSLHGDLSLRVDRRCAKHGQDMLGP